MRINMSRAIRTCRPGALLVLLWVAAASSCSHERRPALNPVRGTVMVQNKPAEKAVVVLRPVSNGPLKGPLPHAEVGPDGSFRISTYKDADGAPEGEYIVTITWPESRKDPTTGDDISEDRLQGRYADASTSQLRVTIKPGENELTPFRIE
jgi:hypothetical protein